MFTIIIGASTVPLWVALVPMTPWMNSGMNRIVPNMPIAISESASTDTDTIRLRNRLKGMIGSIARLSIRPKTVSITAARTNSPMMTGDSQG